MTRFIVAILIKSQHKFIIWNLAIYIFQCRQPGHIYNKLKKSPLHDIYRQWALCLGIMYTGSNWFSLCSSREILYEFLPPGMVVNLWNCCELDAIVKLVVGKNELWMWEMNFNMYAPTHLNEMKLKLKVEGRNC